MNSPAKLSTEQIIYLQEAAHHFNHTQFIATDPIFIPHHFKSAGDIEIAGFFAAILAWGQRTSIIKTGIWLMQLMEWEPAAFIKNHKTSDLKCFEKFVYRTLNSNDLIFLIRRLQHVVIANGSLGAFFNGKTSIKENLIRFHDIIFENEASTFRTRKHVSNPARGSACKRLLMFLRWMVRKDASGVDFGIWNHLNPASLLLPLDVHVVNTARLLGLIQCKQINWQTTEDLTSVAKQVFPTDPALLDFALFGISAFKKDAIFYTNLPKF